MEDNTFEKRDGCTNRGTEYEELVIADLLLKLISDETEFLLSSNNKEFGDFDDIVVETPTITYAIQVKQTKNLLTTESFTKENKSFYLRKFLKSYEKINKPTSFQCVFYTNQKFNGELEEPFKFKNLFISLKKCDKHELFDTEFCYRFVIVNSDGNTSDRDEYEDFFANLVLVTNQANSEERRREFISKFQKEFCCSSDEAEKFLLFLKRWNDNEEEKWKFCKNYVQEAISLCVLKQFIQPLSFGNITEKTRMLREAIDSVDITFVQDNVGIQTLWGDKKKADMSETVEIIMKKFYFNDFSDVNSMDDVKWSKLLWLSGQCPLILAESRTSLEVARLWPYKKFVIVGSNTSDDEFKDCHVFRNLSVFDQESELYKNLVYNFTLSLQGKEEISLHSLIQDYGIERTMVTPTELLKMINGSYEIGQKEDICEPYMSRRLSQNRININYLNSIESDTLVVLDCDNKLDEIKHKIGNLNLINVSIFLKEEMRRLCDTEETPRYHTTPCIEHFVSGRDLYVSYDCCPVDEFLKVCEKNSGKNCHHLRIIDESNLEWIRSNGDISDLKKYCGEPSFMKEKELYNKNPDNKINIIVADPGMGKSQLMKNIKNNTNAKLWNIFIQPKDMTLLCSTSEVGQHLTERRLTEFVIDTLYGSYPDFDRSIIKVLIENQQVVYFWDALDEISTINFELIINLIEKLSEKSCFQWISARSHLQKHLEKKFYVLSRNIQQFSEEEQLRYIRARLKSRTNNEIDEDTNNEINEVIYKIVPILNVLKQRGVLGVPLQISMLTELFQRDYEKYLDLLKKDGISFLTNLFNHIIDEKFNRFYEEKGKMSKSPTIAMKQVMDTHKRCRLKKYQKAAIKALIPEAYQQLNIKCDQFLHEVEDEADGIGLITEVTNKHPQFLHNSYAEFLVAQYFTKSSQKGDFKNIINGNNTHVKFFYDVLTAKNSNAHIGVIYKDTSLLKQLEEDLINVRDEDGRSPLQLACSYGQKCPDLEVEVQGDTFLIDTKNDELTTGESEKYKEMFRYLQQHGTIFVPDQIYLRKLLSYAEDAGCLWTKLIILLEINNTIKPISEKDINFLYFSTKFGYYKVFTLFDDIPLVKIKKDGSSLLHLAVVQKQEDCLKKLLSYEVYKATINERNVNGETALFKACQNGSYFISEILIGAGADMNLATTDGTTPLHTACLHDQLEVVELLVERGSDINIAKNFGVTPLHVASWNGHAKVVEFLLSKGADIDVAADDGCTPLYVASRNNHSKVVKILIDSGADVNKEYKDGATSLFVASQEGHVRNVELLLETEADVNRATTTGQTPLYIARQNGHENVASLLVGKGATEA